MKITLIILVFFVNHAFCQRVDTLIFYQDIGSLIKKSLGEFNQVGNEFFINGNKCTEEEYNNRLMYNDTLKYLTQKMPCKIYINGVLREVCQFQFGLIFGDYKRYNKTGNIEMEGHLNEEGLKVGEWIYYKKKGGIRKRRNYKKPRWYRTVYPLGETD